MKDAAIWIMGSKHRQTVLIAALFLVPFGVVVSMGVATASVLAHGLIGSLSVLVSSFLILAIAGLVSPPGGVLLALIAAGALAVSAGAALTTNRLRSGLNWSWTGPKRSSQVDP